MKSIFHKILFLFIGSSIVSTISCKRTEESFLGPKLIEAREGFEMTGVEHRFYNYYTGASKPMTNTSLYLFVDEQSGYYIKAKFSQEVTWQIEIEQPHMGAKKIFKGTSAELDHRYALWDGTTSNNIMFHHLDAGTDIKVTVSFLGTDLKYEYPFKYKGGPGGFNGKPNYERYMKRYGRGYWIVDDFDGGTGITNTTPEWKDSRLRQEYHDVADEPVVLENTLQVKTNGYKSFHMKGTDSNKNQYIGGINTFSLESLTNGNTSKIPDVSPSDVYVNLFVYGTPQSSMQIKVYELDDFKNYQNVNPAFSYDTDAQKKNDAWTYDFTVNWTGWKMLSVKYSDFVRAANPDTGGNGNGVKEPNKISGIAFTLASTDAYPSGEIFIDYICLTTYGPFIP